MASMSTVVYTEDDGTPVTLADCMAELDAINAANGIRLDGKEFSPSHDASVRTRYAKPGQRSGNGIVRLVSPGQVKFMKFLLETRDISKLVRLPGSEDIEKMSLKGATDLIDRLLGCPELPKDQWPVRKATEGQVKYIESLMAKKGIPHGPRPTSEILFDEVSEIISMLKEIPDEVREVAKLEAGMYLTPDGTMYRVKPSREGRLYAQRVEVYEVEGDRTTVSFVYEAGAIRKLTPEMRMTIEQAMAFGIRTGVCLDCGRELTVKESVERGIGPICYAKRWQPADGEW